MIKGKATSIQKAVDPFFVYLSLNVTKPSHYGSTYIHTNFQTTKQQNVIIARHAALDVCWIAKAKELWSVHILSELLGGRRQNFMKFL